MAGLRPSTFRDNREVLWGAQSKVGNSVMPIINDGQGLDVSRIAKSRRACMVRSMGVRHASILEIGALDNPTFLREEGDVRFADYFSQEESRQRHMKAGTHTPDRIVAVDFVLRDKRLHEAVTDRFDLAIANHVLEHLADPIGWLVAIRNITDHLFLSLPDKRFTFDYFKPCTDAVDWFCWNRAELEQPSFAHILRHLYYHASLNAHDAWQGEIPLDHMHRISFSDAIERAYALEKHYTDVHCSIFTFESFKVLFEDVLSANLVPWKIIAVEDVLPGENEFRVTLAGA